MPSEEASSAELEDCPSWWTFCYGHTSKDISILERAQRSSMELSSFMLSRNIHSTEAFRSVFWLSLTGWKSKPSLEFLITISWEDLVVSYIATLILFALLYVGLLSCV